MHMFFRVLGLLLVPLLVNCSSEKPLEVLRVLAWPGYADADLVQAFERQHNVHVDVTYVNSDDELWSRVQAHEGSDFDVFAVNTAELKRYIDAGLVVPLQQNRIPNSTHQSARFRDLTAVPGITRDGALYAIPYTYSEMGLIYDKGKVAEVPTSMAALWDTRYQGKVLAYDGSNHNFTLTALLDGVPDPFQLNSEQFMAVARRLVDLRRNLLTFYSAPEEVVDLFRNNDVVLVFGNYGDQQVKLLRDAGFDVDMIIPREGVLAWLDCWAVTRGARNRALAEGWINYTLELPVSQALTQRQGLANTVSPVRDDMASERILWVQPVEDFANRSLWWDRIRSGDTLAQP